MAKVGSDRWGIVLFSSFWKICLLISATKAYMVDLLRSTQSTQSNALSECIPLASTGFSLIPLITRPTKSWTTSTDGKHPTADTILLLFAKRIIRLQLED